MKPFAKGVVLGVVLGVALTLALEMLALVGLGLWAESRAGREALGGLVLPPASFPGLAELENQGAADLTWTFVTLEGRETTLEEFHGRPVFLNFWATWCGPCVMELPSIRRLHASLEGSDVALVLASDESTETVSAFLRREDLDLPVYLFTGERPEVFDTPGVPATFILDREGRIVFRHHGAARWDDEACRDFLGAL